MVCHVSRNTELPGPIIARIHFDQLVKVVSARSSLVSIFLAQNF